MEYTIDTAREAVDKGAALLDQKLPWWRREIDWGRFDITSPCDSIMGQCFSHVKQPADRFTCALDALAPQDANWKARFEFAESHGFDVPTLDFSPVDDVAFYGVGVRDRRYELLQAAWLELK